LTTETLVSRILVPGIMGAQIEDEGQAVALHPGEAPIVADCGDKRRRDFTLGRFCAHAALMQFGIAGEAIVRDAGGAPLWPAGFRGSITHTAGYAAALVARKDCFLSVGVDAERVGGVTDHLFARLFNMAERAMLAAQTEDRRKLLATILFSAKEAGIKAWSPMTGNVLSFQDIHVELDEGGFRAMSIAGNIQGLFAIGGGLVLTSAFLPAP
jgi:phosphopantetheine--protein transferase-like protein